MNGTSGIEEVQSSISRSPSSRFLHEQRHQFGTGARHFLRTHDPITPSTDIISSRENTRNTIFRTQNQRFRISSKWDSEGNRNS